MKAQLLLLIIAAFFTTSAFAQSMPHTPLAPSEVMKNKLTAQTALGNATANKLPALAAV